MLRHWLKTVLPGTLARGTSPARVCCSSQSPSAAPAVRECFPTPEVPPAPPRLPSERRPGLCPPFVLRVCITFPLSRRKQGLAAEAQGPAALPASADHGDEARVPGGRQGGPQARILGTRPGVEAGPWAQVPSWQRFGHPAREDRVHQQTPGGSQLGWEAVTPVGGRDPGGRP